MCFIRETGDIGRKKIAFTQEEEIFGVKVGRLVRMIEQLGEEIQQGKFHNLFGSCFREEDCPRDICRICRAVLDLWLHSTPLLLTSLTNIYQD